VLRSAADVVFLLRGKSKDIMTPEVENQKNKNRHYP
jgi:hypothetical protein